MTDRLGHRFADPALRQQALTHRSATGEHNERLEFLGDGLVNLIVAEALYRRFPAAAEGWLTQARTELVRESALARIARDLDLGAALHLGPGEIKAGGRERDSILADALEALAGAIHLDAGFETCHKVVLDWFAGALARLEAQGTHKDAKTRLQEWLQARALELPEYEIVDSFGADHQQVFEVACRLRAPRLEGIGRGTSRRRAEQQAATVVLEQLTK